MIEGNAKLARRTQPQRQAQPPGKGRFSTNLLANILNFGCNIGIGLWFTPYMISHLGVAGYGLIPLATTITSYMGLFTIALNGAVGRYLTIAIERKDTEYANAIFNTSLIGNSIVVCILLLPAIWLSSKMQFFFNVPTGYEHQFSLLFKCTTGMFLLTTLGTAFSLASFCRNRFDLSNAVSIVNSIIRVGVVVLLFTYSVPRVWHVGAGLLFAALFSLIASIAIWRYLTPMLHIQPATFNSGILRQLFGTGGWMIVNQIGTILYLSIDLVVVNRLIGADAAGRYGAIMQWSLLLRGLAGVIAAVFAPTILALYACKDMSGLVRYSKQAVKFVGLLIALPIGVICGLSRPLLHLWLGPKFEPLAPLMSLMTIHLCVNLGIMPLFNISTATNNVRWPGIVTCIMGVANVCLAILLAGPVGWGMYGVAAAGAIMLTAKNLVFTPLYGAHILGIKHGAFFSETIPIITATIGLSCLGWLMGRMSFVQSWNGLIFATMGLSITYVCAAWLLLLTTQERSTVLRMLSRSRTPE
ncbi:MAG: oligosaccharide flippase family protein [Armatimonadota bacterium]|nr:oligosaccharide flippase family protein [bacterium]